MSQFKSLLILLFLSGLTWYASPAVLGQDLPEPTRFPLPELSAFDLRFRVTEGGDDASDGSADHPLQTLEEAIRRTAARPENTSVLITISGTGTRPVTAPILLDGIKGTPAKPVVLCSCSPDGTLPGPVLTGAKVLTEWQPLTESDYYRNASEEVRARFAGEAVGKIQVCSLSGPETIEADNPVLPGQRPEFFVDGVPQTIARWPDQGFTNAGSVHGETVLESCSVKGVAEGVFDYLDERQSRWAGEPDGWCHGYWFWDWNESMQKIASVDTDQHRITFDKPWDGYGFREGFRYYGLNLLCELDSPGEYYLDRANKKLFRYPQEESGQESETLLSCFNYPFMLELRNCENVYVVDMRLEYGRKDAVRFQNCVSCLLIRSEIRGFGGTAVLIEGGHDSGVFGCHIFSLGRAGVCLTGGDRKTLTPCNNFLENSVIEDFGRVKRTYAPGVSAGGCGIRIASNRFENSPSSAMSLSGNDLVVEKNEVFNVVRESDDQGGIDIWFDPTYRGNIVRYNYWKNIVGGTRCGAAGVRLDDIISGFHIYGNIFENCGGVYFGAIQIHGGKDNVIEDNLFVGCPYAVSFSRWGDRYVNAIAGAPESLEKTSLHKKMYEDVDIRSDIWQSRYPELAQIAGDPDVNTVQNNLIVNTPEAFRNDGGVQKMSGNVEMTNPELTVESIRRDGLLEKNNLKPIPFEEIGNYPFEFRVPR